MLCVEDIDLADLALALEDHSDEHGWTIDAASGAIQTHFGPPDGGVAIEPLPVAVGYGDMEDFVAYVRDVQARDLLERAIVGRGAFRRFKDALGQYPELRRAWFAFHDARGERRAIEWLVEHELVGADGAADAIAARSDPEPGDLPGLLDGHGLAHRVALDLRRIYRRRLRCVLLVGAWARGEAHPESPVELVVVLEDFTDRWAEKRRMERTLWRHSVRNGAVVTALPLLAGEIRCCRAPRWTRACARSRAARRRSPTATRPRSRGGWSWPGASWRRSGADRLRAVRGGALPRLPRRAAGRRGDARRRRRAGGHAVGDRRGLRPPDRRGGRPGPRARPRAAPPLRGPHRPPTTRSPTFRPGKPPTRWPPRRRWSRPASPGSPPRRAESS